MWLSVRDRDSLANDLAVARRRAWALTPYSPAWDAAMGIVEDLERALWQVDPPMKDGGADRAHDEASLERVPA